MRLPTDKVWRAFPELDRFSDEQCRGFVKAARRAWGWRLVRAGVMGVALVAAFMGGAMLIMGTMVLVERHRIVSSEGAAWACGVGAGLTGMLCVMVCAAFARDWLLRKRIRFAIFNRGVCQKCDYSLVGMPVSAKSTVVCPECGMESEVDPALGELATDDSGKPVLRAVDESLMPKVRKPRVFTAARMKKAAKWAGAVVLTLVIGGVGWYIWDRYETARQAEIAKKDWVGSVTILAHQGKRFGVAPSGEPNGWDLISVICDKIDTAKAAAWRAQGSKTYGQSGNPIEPNWVYFEPREASTHESREAEFELERELADKSLDECRRAGVLTAIAELLGVKYATWTPIDDGDRRLIRQFRDVISRSLVVADIGYLRMHNAAERGDLEEFTQALKGNLALARICQMHPSIEGWVQGANVESRTLARVRELLAGHSDKRWLDAVWQELSVDRDLIRTPAAYAGEGTQLQYAEAAAWFFSDPTRWSDRALKSEFLMWYGFEGATGSYLKNRLELEVLGAELREDLAKGAWERGHRFSIQRRSTLCFGNMFLFEAKRLMNHRDLMEIEWNGVREMIMLERHRVEHGDYPESVKGWRDPWSGGSLRYQKIDPRVDQYGRGYLLYSVGADGQDNGGIPVKQRYEVYRALVPGQSPGTDFIINDPGR